MTQDASAGTLHADIVLDASGIRRDAKAKIDAAVKGVKAQLKAEIDSRGLVAQARESAKAASTTAKVRIAAELDSRGLIKQAREAAKAASAAAKVRFATELDTTGLIGQAREAAKAASAAAKVRIATELDSRGLIAETRAAAKAASEAGKVHLDVEADTAAAEAKIARLSQRRRRAGVDVKVTGSNELAKVIGDLSKIPALAGGIGVLVSSVGALGGGLIAMAGAGSQAVGVLGALPSVVGAAAQGIAGVLVGISGIGAALKASDAAQKTTTSTATSSGAARVAAAQRVADAQRSLKTAQLDADRTAQDGARRVTAARQDLARAQVQGAQDTADAEHDLARAQGDARDAQESLNQAREEAADRIADMNLQLKGSKLDEEAAALAVERARRRLTQVDASETSSDLDKKEADLAYRQALQHQEELKRSTSELQETTDKANKAGVEGSTEVADAKAKIADANDRVQQAEIRLSRTRVDAEQRVADAQTSVADARRDEARSNYDAQRRVADALRDVQQAQASAASGAAGVAKSTGAAATALDAAMAKLSPAGRKFVRFLQGTVLPKLGQVKKGVQEALLPPLQEGISRALPLLGTLGHGLEGTAKVIGRTAVAAGTLAGSKLFRRDVATIMDSNNRALSDFGDAGISGIKILRDLAVAAGPLVERFAHYVKTLAAARAATVAANRENGKLEAFFQRSGDRAAQLGRIFGRLGHGLYGVFHAAVPAGNDLLTTLDKVVTRFDDWANSTKGQQSLRTFFDGIVPTVKAIGRTFSALFKTFALLTAGGNGSGLTSFFDTLTTTLNLLNSALAHQGFAKLVNTLLVLAGVGGGLGLVASSLLRIGKNLGKLSKVTGVTKVAKVLTRAANPKTGQKAGVLRRAGGAVARGAGRAVRAGGRAVGRGAVRGASAVGRGVARGASTAGSAAAAGAKTVGGALATAGKQAAGYAAALGRATAAAGKFAAAQAVAAARALAARAALILQKGAMLAAAAATRIVAIAQRLFNLALKDNPIGAIITILALLVVGVIYAYKHFATFRKIVDAAWAGIQKAADYAWHKIIKPVFASMVAQIKVVASIYIWLWKHVVAPALKAIGSVISGAWTKVIKPVFTAIRNYVANTLGPRFTWLRDNVIRPVMSAIGSLISGAWTKVIRPTFSAIREAVHRVADAFDTARKAIKTAWDKVRSIVANPVRFVIDTVYNKGIRVVWNKVAGLVGLGKLGEMAVPRGFATGGVFDTRRGKRVVPGYAPGQDVVNSRLSPGEGVLVPETVRSIAGAMRTTPTKAINALNGAFSTRVRARQGRAGSAPTGGRQRHFALGGVFDWLGSKASTVSSWVGDGLGGLGKALKNISLGTLQRGAKLALTPLRSLVNRVLPSSPPWVGSTNKIVNKFIDKIIGKAGDSDVAPGGGGGGGAGVFSGPGGGGNAANQAIGQRLAASLYGWTGNQWTSLRSLWNGESGWNNNAQNPTSTAYGIAQFLDSTWAGVGARKTSNPTGQITAGLRYIKRSYGSPANAWSKWLSRSPHWYGMGGVADLAAGATVLPRQGGTLARLAESGRAETVVDEGLMNQRLARDEHLAKKLDQVIAALKSMPRGDTTIPIYAGQQSIPELARQVAVELAWSSR